MIKENCFKLFISFNPTYLLIYCRLDSVFLLNNYKRWQNQRIKTLE